MSATDEVDDGAARRTERSTLPQLEFCLNSYAEDAEDEEGRETETRTNTEEWRRREDHEEQRQVAVAEHRSLPGGDRWDQRNLQWGRLTIYDGAADGDHDGACAGAGWESVRGIEPGDAGLGDRPLADEADAGGDSGGLPAVSLADIYGAIAYSLAHQIEADAWLREGEELHERRRAEQQADEPGFYAR